MRVVALSAVLIGLAGPGCGRQKLVVGVLTDRPEGGGQGGAAAPGAGGAGAQTGSGGDVGAGGAVALSPSCVGTRFPSVALPATPLSGVPGDSVVGDWNRDGILDLAVVVPGANMINVLLGKGDGTFLPRRDLATASLPVAIAAGDFNHDGNLDLVTANNVSSFSLYEGAGSASVFMGKGNGSFAARADYVTGAQPNVVAIADWTSDGKLDLIAGDTLFAGRGDGTFQRGVTYGLAPWSLVSADFNQDGYLDLMAEPNGVDQVVMLLGRGDGTFFQKSTILSGVAGPVALATGDFNADGRLDAAIDESCPEGRENYLYLLPGRGDGSFDAGAQYVGGWCDSKKLWTGDVDGDGKVDLTEVVASSTRQTVIGLSSVWVGKSDGTFSLRAINAHGALDDLVVPADWNGDGKLDLAVYDRDAMLKVLPAHTDGSFGAIPQYPIGLGWDAVAIVDVGGDGNADLVVNDGNSITVRSGNSNGTFANPTDYPLNAMSYGVLASPITFGDVDGDGHVDLLAASFGENSVKVLPGTGNGSFGSALAYPTNGHPAFPLGLGDVNGDGEADIVVVTSIDGDPSPGYSIEVLFGRGDGGFLTPISSDAVAPHSSDAVVADLAFGAIGDLNGDRVPDVVIGTSTHDLDWQMTILLGKPDGTFARGVDYAADTGSNTVAIGDVNRDGAVDIVTDGELGNAVVWLGAGDGTFLSLDRLPVAQDASCCGGNINNSSRLIDLNGDGALDFVVDVNDRITVLLGRGDGSFACRESYAVDNLPSNFALGDLNHDGRLDLVTTAGAVATIFLASH